MSLGRFLWRLTLLGLLLSGLTLLGAHGLFLFELFLCRLWGLRLSSLWELSLLGRLFELLLLGVSELLVAP